MRMAKKKALHSENYISRPILYAPNRRKLAHNALSYILFATSIVLYCLYMIAFPQMELDFMNLLIYSTSALLVFIGVAGIMKHGLELWSVFLVCFFSVLAFNNFNISMLQKPKTFTDIYFYFFAPLLFCTILWMGEQIPLQVAEKKRGISPNLVAAIVCGLYCCGQIYLFSKTGIRVFSNLWLGKYSANFIIPGISGLVALLRWVMLLMLPDVNRPIQIVIISSSILSSVFSAKRGDAMRIILLIMILYASYLGPKLFTPKIILVFTSMAIIGLLLFSFWGNYRQQQRGWSEEHTIGGFLESRTNNDIINWTFGYTALNFDALKQICIEETPTGEFEEIFVPILRLIGGNAAVENHYKKMDTHGLRGFNATTFLGNFVRENGEFYFIGIVFLAVFILILTQLCLRLQLQGGYGFLLLLTAISFFGNYYLVVNYIFALLATILLYCFIRKSDKYKSLMIKSIL